MRAIVVGGGIGGAAALSLSFTIEGAEVVLLEHAPALAEIGAGLQINANGTRALRHLGVLDEFDSLAVEVRSYRIMQFETGEPVHDQPLGDDSTGHFGGKNYEAHRAACDEAVASDAIRIAAAADGPARLILAPTATHAYPIFPGEPAAARSVSLLGRDRRPDAHRSPTP